MMDMLQFYLTISLHIQIKLNFVISDVDKWEWQKYYVLKAFPPIKGFFFLLKRFLKIYFADFFAFPGYRSRELHQKWSRWDTKHCPDGMLVSQAPCLLPAPSCQPLNNFKKSDNNFRKHVFTETVLKIICVYVNYLEINHLACGRSLRFSDIGCLCHICTSAWCQAWYKWVLEEDGAGWC